MPWFKVDDGFANSRPVLAIPRRYRAQAVGLWTLAGTWSAKELTDGHVPSYVLEDFAATPATAAQLVACGLWEDAESGWQFVGWSKYQPTKVEVLANREREAEKKRNAREAARKAAEQRRNASVPNVSLGDTAGSPEGVPEGVRSTRPDPTRPDPLEEVTTDVVTSSSVPRKRVTRGTRIDPDFFPTQKTVDGIKAETGATSDQLTFQHRKFIDHWLQQSGQRGVKADWDATWRNWMRTACERGQLGNGATVTQIPRNGSRGPTGTQLAYDNLDRLAAKYATESAYPADDYAEIQGELL